MPATIDEFVELSKADIRALLEEGGFLTEGLAAVVEEGAATGAAEEVVAVSTGTIASVLAAFSAPVLVVVLLLFFVVLLSIRLIQHTLEGACYRIPIVGKTVSGWITTVFSFLDAGENFAVNLLKESVNRMWRNIVHFFSVMLTALLPSIPMPSSGPHTTDLTSVYRTLEYQQGEIGRLQDAVMLLQNTVHGSTTIVQANTTPLVDAIHTLEHDVYILHSNEIEFYHELQRIASILPQLESQIQTLATNQGQLHEVQVSFGDLVTQVQQLETSMQTRIADISTETENNHQRLVQLSPLTLLLQPGMKGLRNLRKLEDNPCQCPHIPGFDSRIGTLLAAYEFITNG